MWNTEKKISWQHWRVSAGLGSLIKDFWKGIRRWPRRGDSGGHTWTLYCFSSSLEIPFFSVSALRFGYLLAMVDFQCPDQNPWAPKSPSLWAGSTEHSTLRGSGRSAASFSAYSCIGGWKKTELVCHRRFICFWATAVTFLEKHTTSQVYNTSRLVLSPGSLNLDPWLLLQQFQEAGFTGATIRGDECFVMLKSHSLKNQSSLLYQKAHNEGK